MSLDTDDPKPSTSSSASFSSLADAFSTKIEKLRKEWEERHEQALTRFKKIRNEYVIFEGKDRARERIKEWLVPLLGEERIARWNAGMVRVKNVYRNEYSFEWDLIKLTGVTGFFAGYVIGGMFSLPESKRRFELATTGKKFTSVGFVKARQMDYTTLRFMNRGFIEGCQLGLVNIFVVVLTLGLTVFRDYYSMLHFPIATAPVAVFAGNTTWRGWAWTGVRAAAIVSVLPNSLVLLATAGACAYYKCWPNECYWTIKWNWEEDLRREAEEQREMDAYQRERGYWALMRKSPFLKGKMEKEKELGTWKYGEEGGLDRMLKEMEEEDPMPEHEEEEESREKQKRKRGR